MGLFKRKSHWLQRSEGSNPSLGLRSHLGIYDELERRVITFAVRVGITLRSLDLSWIDRLHKTIRGNDGRCI